MVNWECASIGSLFGARTMNLYRCTYKWDFATEPCQFDRCTRCGQILRPRSMLCWLRNFLKFVSGFVDCHANIVDSDMNNLLSQSVTLMTVNTLIITLWHMFMLSTSLALKSEVKCSALLTYNLRSRRFAYVKHSNCTSLKYALQVK